MLDIYRRLAVLDQLYQIYDQYIDTIAISCKKFCADCCTCNVTMTTLEAQKILHALDLNTKNQILEKVTRQQTRQRFIPQITTNQLADICIRDDDPPEETLDPSWGPCPLLIDDACPLYDLRPFGCRNMISTRRCAETGAAEIDEFTLTVNNVFLQYVEHIDQNGFFGNLSDVLAYAILNNSGQSETHIPVARTTLIKNRPMPALLIPPEHRAQFAPIMAALQAIKA